ncbi:MAG TPA: leucyl aminopeptidase [candidate division Zixibacteria bacterium]|jgi:leucyl aminopeptidase|nr:leucyl aminopeptidase [candidate division Zixibacteria bacterium]
MTIDVNLGRIGSDAGTTVIVGLFEDDQLEEGTPPVLDASLRRYLREILALGDFKGKKHQMVVLYPHGAAPPQRALLIGLGDRNLFSLETARRASGRAVSQAFRLGTTELTTAVHGLDLHGFSPEACAQATVEGILLGAYRYDRYKTTPEERPPLDRLTVIFNQRSRAESVQNGVEAGRISAAGANLARDLSNAPGNDLPPRKLASKAREMSKSYDLKCEILTRENITKEKMGALLAVSAGSEEPPRFIVLEYGEPSDDYDTIVFVGKGITFDSGGISLKPGSGMEEMKHDMSGAAAVVGAMRAIGEMKPPLHVVGLIPSSENLPDGKALKPGDIITAYSGKTIEIINTDAEGRLVLADALGYADRYKPAAVIDLATLTGACVVALGHAASGMMGNDENLMTRVRSAGDTSGERVWPLPLWEEYHDEIKSHIADVKNTGGRWGGALTAGAFLEKFVDYPWVHLDIAGPAYSEKATDYCPQGATGAGTRLLIQMIRDWGAQ